MHHVSLSDLGPPVDRDVGQESRPFADRDVLADDAIGTDFGVIGEIRFGMDNRRWMNFHS
jgi:hypothetical protein